MRDNPTSQALRAMVALPRRQLLAALVEHEPNTVDPESVTTAHPTALYHTHLPKLADGGFVEWDRDSGTVRPGRNWREIRPLVEALVDRRDDLPAGTFEPPEPPTDSSR